MPLTERHFFRWRRTSQKIFPVGETTGVRSEAMNIPSSLRESFGSAPRSPGIAAAVGHITAWAALAMGSAVVQPSESRAQESAFPPAATSNDSGKDALQQVHTHDPVEVWKRDQLPVLLQKLKAEIPALDDDAFATRERAQKSIQASLLELVKFMNPRPPEVDAAILQIITPKKDVHSVEQVSRLRYANSLMEYESADAPTRIALLPNSKADHALAQLRAQSGISVSLSDVPDHQRLQQLNMETKNNSYAEVLQQICRGLQAYPAAAEGPDSIALRPHDDRRRNVFADKTGRFLCVEEEAGEDGIPVLRVFCDPQIAMATLKGAEAVNMHGHYHVVIEMTKFQWPTGEGVEKLGKPELTKSTADYCSPHSEERFVPESEKHRRAVLLHGALLAQPKDYDLPLDGTAVNTSSQIAAATYNAEKGAVSVRAKASNPIDTPTTFWIEAAVNCNTFTLLDDQGKVLYTGRGTLVYRPDVGHVFDIDLPATVKPAQVRMRGYGYLTDWNRSSSGGDGVLLELPKR
jgi:hypothetical protein